MSDEWQNDYSCFTKLHGFSIVFWVVIVMPKSSVVRSAQQVLGKSIDDITKNGNDNAISLLSQGKPLRLMARKDKLHGRWERL